jgi:hypothetical protein
VRVEWLSTGEAETGAAGGLARSVRWTFGLALAACVGTAAWLVWRTAILEPYSDMFDWLERYYRFRADGDLLRYLWAPHNFHHLVATFTVLALDIRAFGASGYFFLATGALCWAATAAMMAALGAEAAGPGLRLIGGGGAAALALMGCDVLDATADINTTYVYALAFATGAILAAESRSRGVAPRLAALAMGVVAGLGSAAGLAVWPALLVSAWRRGERRWTAMVLAAGAASAALYAIGEDGVRPAAHGLAGAKWLAEAASLALNCLGLPWGRGLPGWGAALGFVVVAASLAALLAALRRPGRLARAAAAMIVFSLGTVAMTAAGRTGLVPAALAPMRYAVFLIPLHVGVWIVVLPSLRRAWLARPRAMQAVAVAAALLIVAHQAVMAVYAVRTADMNRAVIDAFHAGATTPAMLTTIYPDLSKARAISDQLRREGLYQRELRAAGPAS